MIAIGNYFVFIIIVMGTLLAARDLNNKAKKEFSKRILDSHNFYRKAHDAPKLVLNKKMCKEANRLLTTWTGSPDTMEIPAIYGSNTYVIDFFNNSLVEPNMISDNWYNYNAHYDYSHEPLTPKSTDPFTQIVWKSTREIGVGISTKNDALKVLVIYSPPGNQIGHYMSNVIDPREITGRNVDLTDAEKQKFFEDIVYSHNFYRRYYNSQFLYLDKELCVMADTYLKELKANEPVTLPDSHGVNYSETRFVGTSRLDPEGIVTSWYNRQIFYDFKNGPTSPEDTNPFTQVVWKNTEKIGVGILIIDNKINVAVIYFPAGNQPGQYMSNVKGPR